MKTKFSLFAALALVTGVAAAEPPVVVATFKDPAQILSQLSTAMAVDGVKPGYACLGAAGSGVIEAHVGRNKWHRVIYELRPGAREGYVITRGHTRPAWLTAEARNDCTDKSESGSDVRFP